jgi:GntR family transcriptional regulator/MocR family aminotransferase
MPRRPSHSTFRAFELDSGSADALHRQLYDELRKAILSGRLAAGSRLPASRELAAESHVSRNTVLSAYEQLLAEGYIVSRAGSGTFVADAIPESFSPAPSTNEPRATTEPAPRLLSKRGETLRATPFSGRVVPTTANAFRIGLPALDHFPMDIWRRIADKRLRRASVRLLTYTDAQGYEPLRQQIADHLAASRGVRCAASNIVIMNGSQQGIALCTRLLTDAGDDVWMEDPGYFAARAALLASGVRVVSVPVDQDGLDVAEGRRRSPRARMAYVTPSHQNPTGATMTLARRMALLQWAREAGAWIVEDDNASEYRYRGRPLAALQGIDTSQRVIYVGSFSKVLFSSLRIGYVVLPDDLVETFVLAHQINTRGTNSLLQAMVADFMSEGHFARHLRRMRTLYAGRLAALERSVAAHAADVLELQPIEGGLNRLALLPPGVSDLAVSEALAAEGVIAVPLAHSTDEPRARGGLVLGFTGVDEHQIDAGIARIAAVVRTLQRAGALHA